MSAGNIMYTLFSYSLSMDIARKITEHCKQECQKTGIDVVVTASDGHQTIFSCAIYIKAICELYQCTMLLIAFILLLQLNLHTILHKLCF